jgi:hypothetical protein
VAVRAFAPAKALKSGFMQISSLLARHRARLPAAIFVLISALYFADTMLRASLKAFWFDELLTVYLSRLPSFHATWTTAEQGVDFNPPLFFLISRGAHHLFGEGLIATRLPAMLGFWLFGLCLYRFASRSLGRVGGLIAALVPIFTLAGNYAYEARAYGIVLAWCGLMLVFWQESREPSLAHRWPARAWTLVFGLSYLCALLTHVYALYLAAPFLLVEAVALLRRRRVSWLTCLALFGAIAMVAPLYLRMIAAFRSMLGGNGGLPLHNFILAIYGPSLLLMLTAIALSASARKRFPEEQARERLALSRDESILALTLFLLPIIGGVGVQLSHGLYFDRYFLACTGGFALLFAQSLALSRRACMPRVLGAMLLLLLADLGLAVRASRGADLFQIEPASHFRFGASPERPLERDAALRLDQSQLDVLVAEDHNFLYLFYYAPEQVRRRLVFAAPDQRDFFLASYRILQHSANLNLRTATYTEFFATHSEFLLYAPVTGIFSGCPDCLQPILDAGYTLRSVQRDADSLLEHFSK